MPIRRLGILVFPLSIASILFALVWQQDVRTVEQMSSLFSLHILVSLLAYALLAIALIQAVLYLYQERQLKARAQPGMLTALPPLQTMKKLWFRLVLIGFLFLSLTLISGTLFSKEIFGYPFVFKHHTVLAIAGWIVFAILIVKHLKSGVRGVEATAWTIGGFALIQLGYFGTKIVSESLQLS